MIRNVLASAARKVVLVSITGGIAYASYKVYEYYPTDAHIFAMNGNIKDLEEHIKKYPNNVNSKTWVSKC